MARAPAVENSHVFLGRNQDVRRGKGNEWLIFVKICDTVVAFLSLFKALCDELLLH